MTDNDKILIVEDSPTQRERLRHLLETSDYRVDAATNGEAALAAMRESLPALVVTDVVMPGMNGYDLCRAMKSDDELREVPVILLTSLSEPQDVVRSLECGADNFIRKPYDERYLLSRISNILTSRELRLSGRLQVGLEVVLAGEKHFINADRQQILDFLLSTYEEVDQVNTQLLAKNTELHMRQVELEQALAQFEAERRRAEDLANVNAAVLDATAEGIALIDLDGRPYLSNRAFRRLVRQFPGLALEGTFDENVAAIADLVHDRSAWLAFARSLVDDPEREATHEIELGEPRRSLRLFTAPVFDSGATRIGRIFVLREVTAERAAERLKDDLVATVSHELRTPLASIYGFSELMASSALDAETQMRYARMIHAESRRLADLINDFLDLQRIEEGQLALVPAPVDLSELLLYSAKLFSGQSAQHEIVADVPPEPLEVVADEGRIRGVVANLLSNAIKYSPDGGKVVLQARQRHGVVHVSVRDEGIGIPADQQERIFTKFFRVDSSDTRRIGGTGLGLALSREIVEAHGGRIGFESTEGEGTTFWFEVPAAGVSPQPADAGLADGAIAT